MIVSGPGVRYGLGSGTLLLGPCPLSLTCAGIHPAAKEMLSRDRDCLLPVEEAGVLWDSICFLFLLLQRRVFLSRYFLHVSAELQATALQASRSALGLTPPGSRVTVPSPHVTQGTSSGPEALPLAGSSAHFYPDSGLWVRGRWTASLSRPPWAPIPWGLAANCGHPCICMVSPSMRPEVAGGVFSS